MVEIKFDKPYRFEGEEYTSVILDLDGLNTLQILAIENRYKKDMKNTEAMKATDLRFILMVAEKASDKPYEFFTNLPAKESAKLKGEVMPFLLNTGDDAE